MQDGTYAQKLIPPATEKGQKKTLTDLLEEFSTPVRRAGRPNKRIFIIQETYLSHYLGTLGKLKSHTE